MTSATYRLHRCTCRAFDANIWVSHEHNHLTKNWNLSHNSKHWVATKTDSVSLPTYSRPKCITSIVTCTRDAVITAVLHCQGQECAHSSALKLQRQQCCINAAATWMGVLVIENGVTLYSRQLDNSVMDMHRQVSVRPGQCIAALCSCAMVG